MIKSFLIYLPSILFPRLAAFLTILIGMRLLSTEAFGYYSLATLIGEFADMVLTNWTRLALIRFGATMEGVPRVFAIKLAAASAGSAILAASLAALAAMILAPEQGMRFAFVISFYVAAVAMVRYGLALNQAAGMAYRTTNLEIGRSILVLIATTAAMARFGDFLSATLAAAGVSFGIGTIALVSGLRITKTSLRDTADWKAVAAYAGPLLMLAVATQAISSLDKVLLKTFQDAATLGVYSATYTVARSGFDIVAGAFNAGGFVSLSMLQKEGRTAEAGALLQRQLGLILAVALPAAAMLISTREVIALSLFPPAYHQSFQIAAPFVVLGAVAMNIKCFVYDNVFHLHLRNILQLPPLIAGALAGSVAAILLMPNWPVLGAALTYVIGAATALAITIGLSARLTPITLPFRAIGVAAATSIVAFIASELLQLLMSGAPASVVLIAQAPLAVAAIALSLALANSTLGTRNANLAVSFVTSDPERLTGLSSYADSLIDAIARDPACGTLVILTNAAAGVLPKSRGRANIRWIELPQKPRFVPYKLYSPAIHALASFFALRNKCGAYLSTTADGCALPFVDQYITIHDLYDFDPGSRPMRTVAYAHAMWRLLALVSRGIVCVSDATREEAAAAMPFAKARMVTIKEASKFAPEPAARPDQPPHFLYVANIQSTKNVECLLLALRHAESEGETLLVRWIGRDPLGILAAFGVREGLPQGFMATGPASDEELREAFRRATALIVCSWKEGFCLPVLEAHALGTPVIASDLPVLREVAGEGAAFFDPHRPEQLLAALRSLRSNPELRERLSEAASANILFYSWEKAAREILMLTTSLFETRTRMA
jgi:glycosyltransferase involved in cell wall biosynthesis/O-antigen/teichoic acid export membrane protein